MLGVMTAKEPGASIPMEEKKNKDILINHSPVAVLLKCIFSFSMELYKVGWRKLQPPQINCTDFKQSKKTTERYISL